MLHSEGVAGFYRGFAPVLAGVLPATMVYFYAYETAKQLLPRRLGAARDFAVGTAAQLCAGVVFTPVDVVKERLQVPGNLPLPCRSTTCDLHCASSADQPRFGQGSVAHQ